MDERILNSHVVALSMRYLKYFFDYSTKVLFQSM